MNGAYPHRLSLYRHSQHSIYQFCADPVRQIECAGRTPTRRRYVTSYHGRIKTLEAISRHQCRRTHSLRGHAVSSERHAVSNAGNNTTFGNIRVAESRSASYRPFQQLARNQRVSASVSPSASAPVIADGNCNGNYAASSAAADPFPPKRHL